MSDIIANPSDPPPWPLCCTPEEAWDWVDLLINNGEPPEIVLAAIRHATEIDAASE